MLKSVYDTDGDSIVDAAESVPWTGVSGKPTIGDMLKSTYDTNSSGTVDAAESVAWTAVTGRPGTPTTSAAGLVPALPATYANLSFLSGNGAFTFIPFETATTATFAIPAAGGTATIAINTVTWGAVGQLLFISDNNSWIFAELTTRSSNTSWIVTARAYPGIA
jgi:hypothetical protein